MKFPAALATAFLLSSCGESQPMPSAEMAARFAEIGEVPSCATMEWAIQTPNREGYTLSARYNASGSCNQEWDIQLAAADFEAQIPHGEWVKRSEQLVLVSSANDGARAVIMHTPIAVDGVEIFMPEESQ